MIILVSTENQGTEPTVCKLRLLRQRCSRSVEVSETSVTSVTSLCTTGMTKQSALLCSALLSTLPR